MRFVAFFAVLFVALSARAAAFDSSNVQFVSGSAAIDFGDTPGSGDVGVFEMEFNIFAIEDTFYFKNIFSESGNVAAIKNGSTNSLFDPSATVLDRLSGGSTVGMWTEIEEDEVVRFKLTAHFIPPTSGFYRLELHQLEVAIGSPSGATAQAELDPSEFHTEFVSLKAVPEPASMGALLLIGVACIRRRS